MSHTDLLAGKRILILEDGYFLTAEVRALLMTLKVTIVGPVATAEVALILLQNSAVDAVIIAADFGGDFISLAEFMEDLNFPYLVALNDDMVGVDGDRDGAFFLSVLPGCLDIIARALFHPSTDGSVH